MGEPTDNIYFSSGSSRIPRSRQPSTSDEQNILPHLLVPLSCESQFHPYLGASEDARNIGVQFTAQGTPPLDSDLLQRRLSFDHESPVMAVHSIGYPESSQRTTSHALSPYATDASRFSNLSSCDLATLHIVDAPLHGAYTSRRGSWPSHLQYSTWMQSAPRTARSPASEPPESTSGESFQDSDGDDVTQMSPMMNQFQIHSTRNVDFPSQHMYHAQALQPSVITFQLSHAMLQPVDDPENRHTLRRLLDMNIVADEESRNTHSPPPSTFPSPSFGGAGFQGPSMRLRRDSEKPTRTSQYRVPVASNSVPFPSHSPTNARIGDQRASGSKQPKKSKMHQCEKCKKLFPRPSGLATHMNSHSGAKPFKCIVPNCNKSFAVRSNAKRHLRTHGINPSSPQVLSMPRFTVGFEEPVVTQVHNAGRPPARYRWITHNPSSHESQWGRQGPSSSTGGGGSRASLTFQTSMSSATSSTLSSNVSDEEYLEAASSSVDIHQYQSDYSKSTDKFPGSYSNYREHPRRG